VSEIGFGAWAIGGDAWGPVEDDASLSDQLSVPLHQAQAVYRALAAPGVYRELVQESGWTPADFEDWVNEVLLRQLLPDSV